MVGHSYLTPPRPSALGRKQAKYIITHFTEEETALGREDDSLSARASGRSSGTFSGLEPSPCDPPPYHVADAPPLPDMHKAGVPHKFNEQTKADGRCWEKA